MFFQVRHTAMNQEMGWWRECYVKIIAIEVVCVWRLSALKIFADWDLFRRSKCLFEFTIQPWVRKLVKRQYFSIYQG
jgi:hypothetical protein